MDNIYVIEVTKVVIVSMNVTLTEILNVVTTCITPYTYFQWTEDEQAFQILHLTLDT